MWWIHVEKVSTLVTRVATYLEVVAVSRPRYGLFVPKGSQRGGHCPPVERFPGQLLCPPFAT